MPEGKNLEDEIKQKYEALLQKIEANKDLTISEIKNDIAGILGLLNNERLYDSNGLDHIKKNLNNINRSLTLDMGSLLKNAAYSIPLFVVSAFFLAVAIVALGPTGGAATVFFGAIGSLLGVAATYFGKCAYDDFKKPSLNLKNLRYNRELFYNPDPVTSSFVASNGTVNENTKYNKDSSTVGHSNDNKEGDGESRPMKL